MASSCTNCSKPGVLVFERGDTVTIRKIWPAAAVKVDDAWRFRIRTIDSWIEDPNDTRLFFEGPISVTTNVDGSQTIETIIPQNKSTTVKFGAHFGLRVTNSDGSKTVEQGTVEPWVSPVEPGAGPVVP